MLFTFITLTFNHEKYILQHLESIKFQIETFGQDFDFQLIIADDKSTDKTLQLANLWCKENCRLFTLVEIEESQHNNGTCENYTRVWEKVKGTYFKTLAGDDLFAKNNIFKYLECLNGNNIVSGLPIRFGNNKIMHTTSEIKQIIATDIIYKKHKFFELVKRVSVMNTPSLYYETTFLKNINICNFVKKFNVIEDYPTIIKIAEVYPETKYQVIPKVMVLYRRTEGSTFIVKKNAFYYDRVMLFEYLINNEKSIWNKFLQKNRLFCFKLNNSFLRQIFNIDYYLYIIKFAVKYKPIMKRLKEADINFDEHQQYLDKIIDCAKTFENKVRLES
ncbi:MAG: glycosyltransferase, family 2 [Bacillales bacterium]|jgi:glycosyltransferase involved in cell wall biosynthesis|nr:glycosyltransferase, family 2 [Bacillales bacterium]